LDHAGDIYLKCNETEAAREFWEKALKVSDDAQETKAIQKKLKRHQ
jgi:predicted negative regulator of RcsB-dependent stress response